MKTKMRGIECALLCDTQILRVVHGQDWLEMSARELRAAPAMESTIFNTATMTITVLDAAEWRTLNDTLYLQLSGSQ
jgi:hypothetical protein